MAKPTKEHVGIAERLLVRELESAPGGAAAAAGRMHGAMFAMLSPIIGAAGVHALFARSVKVCVATHPTLLDVITPAERSEEQAESLAAGLARQEASEAARVVVEIYAMFFALLSGFIGQPMLLQILGGAFPALDLAAPLEKDR